MKLSISIPTIFVIDCRFEQIKTSMKFFCYQALRVFLLFIKLEPLPISGLCHQYPSIMLSMFKSAANAVERKTI